MQLRLSRAKTVLTKEWVIGYPLMLKGNNQEKFFIFPKGIEHNPISLNDAIVKNMPSGNYWQEVFFNFGKALVEVEKDSIGESTGLFIEQDNEQRTVFVGDILEDEFEQIRDVVRFSNKSGYFELINNDLETLKGEIIDNWKVIGNVFDNPDIVKDWYKCQRLKPKTNNLF